MNTLVTTDQDSEKGEDGASIQTGDVRVRQEFRGWTLLWLAAQSVGTIYGDIGTSPLYVYSSTFTEPPAKDELLCAASLIVWSLFIMVTIKYICIALYADDEGEGGTFALYSLLARYAKIEDREPGKPAKELNRHPTVDICRPTRSLRSRLEGSRFFKLSVRMAAIFGVCCVMADGVFTPAQSVLGAIQGVRVQNPDLSTNAIIGISIAILAILFIAQPLGINRLANGYAPIVAFWLILNLSSAFYNFVHFDTAIFKALNPYYAGRWFTVRGSDAGFRRLGGILLCFTGVEALFADMGAFSRKATQLSWLACAWPCLTLTYLGQAANISINPENYSNPFFLTLPPGCFWPGLIASILAAIVASQAMITGAFQILSQAMQLCYFPRIRIKFTSKVVHGQCYVPLANWLLGAGCIIVTGAFNNTTALGNAYGLCVILVTIVTTCLVGLVAIIAWRFNPFLVLPIWLIFLTWDALWLSISVFKVPDGAWVTIMIACVLALVMTIWRAGKTWQWRAEAEQLQKARSQVLPHSAYPKLEGIGVFFDEADDRIPAIFTYWLRSVEAQYQVSIFAHMRRTYRPVVDEANRFEITPIPEYENTYKVLIRYGYNEPHASIAAAGNVVAALSGYINTQKSNSQPGTPRHAEALAREEALERAGTKREPVFLFGRKNIQVGEHNQRLLKKAVIWLFASIRDVMTSKPRLFELDSDRVIEIGKAVPL